MKKDLEDQVEVRNLPRIVSHENVFYTSTQTNLAPAALSGQNSTLGNNLGVAGVKHRDPLDHPVNGTVMFLTSDKLQEPLKFKKLSKPILYKDLAPAVKYMTLTKEMKSIVTCMDKKDKIVTRKGFFYFPTLGVYIELDTYDLAWFNGQNYHCGESPYVLNHLIKAIVRMTNVKYPSWYLIERTAPIQLVTLGDKVIESNGASDIYREPIKDSGHQLAFITHGDSIMLQQDHMNFVTRESWVHMHECFRHLPAHYEVQVDMKKFMSSITYVDANSGKRCSPDEWALAPGISAEVDLQRRKISERLFKRYDKHILTLPALIPANISDTLKVPKILGGKFVFL